MDTIRVLRVIEIVGPRDAVEKQVRDSLHGEREGTRGPVSGQYCIIRAATVGLTSDIIEMGKVEQLMPSVTAPRALHTACVICGEQQFETPAGTSCPNGHGGAAGF